jgi:hypothetical protein
MESRTDLMLRYTRQGGRKPPRDREILEIEPNGAYMMWRSVGSSSYPPVPIGRFSGELSADQLSELQAKVDAVKPIGKLEVTPPPGAAIEKIEGNKDLRLTCGAHDEPEGPWGELIEYVRELLDQLTESPQAVIALTVQQEGQKAQLTHRGSSPLRVDLSDLTVRAVLWEGYNNKGDWHWDKTGRELPSETTVNQGWSFDLPFGHGFEVASGQEVVAYVTFTAFDDKKPVPVMLESPRSEDA